MGSFIVRIFVIVSIMLFVQILTLAVIGYQMIYKEQSSCASCAKQLNNDDIFSQKQKQVY